MDLGLFGNGCLRGAPKVVRSELSVCGATSRFSDRAAPFAEAMTAIESLELLPMKEFVHWVPVV